MLSVQDYNDLLKSSLTTKGVNTNKTLLYWIENENAKTKASLFEIAINNDSFWFYDSNNSIVRNRNNSFFSISGIDNGIVKQPIIIQNEVGYLGFIGKKIDGVIHFLVQAKIEPGNVNNVQLSPTIQATESNFTQKHGGRAPHYLEYFKDVTRFRVVYDGNEPEQCSRFYKKYNRNVIILLDDDESICVLDNFKWMTIGQIKFFANNYDNLVNMDTRTVLSCIPYDFGSKCFDSSFLMNSVFADDCSNGLIARIKKEQLSLKQASIVRIDSLSNWSICDTGLFCKKQYPFCFKYFDIEINGREVTHWTQPLAVANGSALFALGYIVVNQTAMFIIKICQEIGCEYGSCFGPTIQFEAPYGDSSFVDGIQKSILSSMFNDSCDTKTILSEEGGRFYHEENLNVICRIDCDLSVEEIESLGYILASYKTIRALIEKTHMVNIQLRNLLSLLMNDYEKN